MQIDKQIQLNECRIDNLRVYGVDGATGECLDVTEEYYIVNRAAEDERRRRKEQWLDGRAQIAVRAEFPFIWTVYKSMNRLLEKVPSKYVAMLFFLATYQNYKGDLTTGRKPIYKLDLPKLLDVSRATAYRFWGAIENAGVGREEADGRLCLDEQYFRRGAVDKQELAVLAQAGRGISRLYIKSIRDMYRRAGDRDKSAVGHLLRIIPFVHHEYNIVCHNPAEQKLESIRPMRLEELCRAIGYGEENASRLWEELSKLKFKVLDKECVAVRRITPDDIDGQAYKLFVNPHAYYSGKSWEQVKAMGGF